MAQDAQEQQALLDGIRNNPVDDAPRLAYADWLNDNDTGDGKLATRAEFIRVQCQLADANTQPEQRILLQDREEELLTRNRDEWEIPLRELGAEEVVFSGGLPSGVLMEADAFISNADKLFAANPAISSVKLEIRHSPPDVLRNLAGCPHLSHLQALDLSDNAINDAALAEFVVSPHIKRVNKLNLCRNGIHDEGIKTLAGSPYLANLETLHLAECWITDKGVAALMASRRLSRLQTLNLDHNDITDAGVQELAASPRAAGLTRLNLARNWIRDEGACALARSPYLAALQMLDLSANRISDAGARSLAMSSSLKNLTELSFELNEAMSPQVREEVESAVATRRDDKGRGCWRR